MTERDMSIEDLMIEVKRDLEKYYMCLDPVAAVKIIEVMEYTMKNGKRLRGKMVMHSYLSIVKQPTDDSWQLCKILACCVEILETAILIIDDFLDHGKTRRGRICWYMKEPTHAINHGEILASATSYIIRLRFRNHERFVELIELLEETKMKTIRANATEFLLARKLCETKQFSMSSYESIASLKNFYTVCFPVKLALLLANVILAGDSDMVDCIGGKIALYFQVQDDFMDVYVDPLNSGKTSSDIKEGKCTWFVAKALELMTESQTNLFHENYGKCEQVNTTEIITIYSQLDLQLQSDIYLRVLRNEIETELSNIASTHALVSKLLQDVFNMVRKRFDDLLTNK